MSYEQTIKEMPLIKQYRSQPAIEHLDAKHYLTNRKPGCGVQVSSLTAPHTLKRNPDQTRPIPSIRHILVSPDMETYNGHVRTPADAIVLFEACRLGLLPRVQRRLSEKERQSIKSGSVFVWDEREAGMRRWTDGKSWSASRVSGSFLTYREMEGKRGGNNFGPPLAAVARAGRTPDSTRGSDSDHDLAGEDGPDGYRYKPDGLMKQSFSITTSSGNHLHLISYYSRAHPATSTLTSPTNDQGLRQIRPVKGMYPESTVHEHQNIPAVTRSPMASAPYSTVPQMAGYARQGPPQWSPHYNGYGQWPTHSMPQQQAPPHFGYQYGGNGHHYSGGPPPPTNGHSPLSHSQSAQPPSTSPPNDPHAGSYEQRRFPPMSQPIDPQMNNYDPRRGVPPATQQQYADSYRQPIDPNISNYDPRNTPIQYRSPSTPSDTFAPQQYPNRNPHQANGIQQMQAQTQAQQHTSSPRSQQPQYMPPNTAQPPPIIPPQHQQQSQSATSTPLDPRLFAPSPIAQQSQQPQAPQQVPHHSRTPTPSSAAPDTITISPSHTNGISQASMIPSIGSIMNGASAKNHKSPTADSKEDRSGDRTPGGSAKKEGGPQDIPSDKLGFSEDMRTLKVLDKSFKA